MSTTGYSSATGAQLPIAGRPYPTALNRGLPQIVNPNTPAGQAGAAQTGTAAQGGNAGAAQGGGAKQTTDPLQPNYINPNTFGPQATLKQILAGFQPQARQQQGALNSQLAAAGIVGGGAQSADQLLAAQQSSALAPTLAQAIQGSQGMQLTAEQGNQQAANAAKSQLANYMMQGWEIPYQAQAGLYDTALGGASSLAGIGANNFAVPPQSNLLNLWGTI